MDGNEPLKPENVPLSVTYDNSQEPTYYPAPYASGRVPSYSEHCIQNANINQKNLETFGSGRGGYTYDIPYPPRRVSTMYSDNMLIFIDWNIWKTRFDIANA